MMPKDVDIRGVVKHLVDGTLDETLCRVCLLPLGEFCENIFTTIYKDDKEFCVADVLKTICNVEFSETDRCNVCTSCFTMASTTLKFYSLAKCTEEILNFYVNEIGNNVDSVFIDELTTESVCISLPEVQPYHEYVDVNPKIWTEASFLHLHEPSDDENVHPVARKRESELSEIGGKKQKDDYENLVVVVRDSGAPLYYKFKDDLTLELIAEKSKCAVAPNPKFRKSPRKHRKKRDPMTYRKCSKCPVKYRFVAKLKEHMKLDHNIDLFVCKVCKAINENEIQFNLHLKTHTNILCCYLCNKAFKKRKSMIDHLKWHEDKKNMSSKEGVSICEQCGTVLPTEEQLQEHYDTKHVKKYTCYYCGKMYKGELSFDMHIKKHEMHAKPEERHQKPEKVDKTILKDKRVMCSLCGRYFVDERALMWHTMLHTNERPYKCDVCARAFVSAARRNQHARCAHSAPTRRCPLCPALFHLTSMVNTHIKKVHLKTHKRRNRASKHLNVCWRTETVPIQDLSIAIQNELLDLKSKQDSLHEIELDEAALDPLVSD